MKDLTLVHVLAVVTVALGVLMIVRAFQGGGNLGSFGVLIGALFIAAGVLRLRLLRARATGATPSATRDEEAR